MYYDSGDFLYLSEMQKSPNFMTGIWCAGDIAKKDSVWVSPLMGLICRSSKALSCISNNHHTVRHGWLNGIPNNSNFS